MTPNKKVLAVVLMLMCVVWAGCLDDAEPGDVEPPPPVAEPPGLLFLTFPYPCPDDHTGNTTYNLSEEQRIGGRSCGPGRLESMMNPGPCSIFQVHDPSYAVKKGDMIHAYMEVDVGPTAGMEVHFTWQDTRGAIATFARPVGFFPGESLIDADFNTTVLRDSVGPISLVIQASNDYCGGASVEGQTPTYFEVNTYTPYWSFRG